MPSLTRRAHPRRRARRAAAALAATALAGTFVLAGCTGDDADPQPEASEPVTLIGPGADIRNDVAARADVVTDSCEPDDEEGTSWTVKATATNSTEETAAYDLAIRFARKSDGSVLGREATTTDPIKPGESAEVSVTSKLDEPSDEINCVFVAISRTSADEAEK